MHDLGRLVGLLDRRWRFADCADRDRNPKRVTRASRREGACAEKAGERLGMTPAKYKKGGKDLTIGYTIVDSRIGKLLVAATERGICAVSFGDDEDAHPAIDDED